MIVHDENLQTLVVDVLGEDCESRVRYPGCKCNITEGAVHNNDCILLCTVSI